MKIFLPLALALVFVSCASTEKSSDSTVSTPQRWKNVDGELKTGAKKAKGLLERIGVIQSDEGERADATPSTAIAPPIQSSLNPSTSESSNPQEGGFWSSIRGGLNSGWNKVVGLFTSVGERNSSEEE